LLRLQQLEIQAKLILSSNARHVNPAIENLPQLQAKDCAIRS
jgi:hypothetical protein